MPKQVDADARRAELAAATRRAILRQGLEGVTLREVAREAGWSIGVLTHYFETKDELLRYSLADPAWVMYRLPNTIPDDLPGIVKLLEGLLPTTADMREMWQVWMTFWVSWPGDSVWDGERRTRQRRFRRYCRDIIHHALERGQLCPGRDVDADGDALAMLVHGLGVLATLDPAGWSAKRQRAEVEAFFAVRLPAAQRTARPGVQQAGHKPAEQPAKGRK